MIRTRNGWAVILAWLTLVTSVGAQLSAPTGWKWVTDAPSRHATSLDPKPGEWLFGQMPPGWHITTGPGVVLFEPSATARGRFAVEAETFIFPGESPSGFGLLVGGKELEAPGARYVAFLIRRDGSAAVERFSGAPAATRTLAVPWTRHEAILPHAPKDAVRNVLRLEIEADAATFLVNGKEVAKLPREGDELDGLVGFRIGADINIHVTNLDVTARFAPPRRPKK